MIACFDEQGWIYNIYVDPIPEKLAEHLTGVGVPFVEVDFDGSSVDLSNEFYVAAGVVLPRPLSPGTVAVSGLTITLTGLAPAASVVLVLDADTSLETRHTIAVDGASASIALDEAGPLRLVVSAPWPHVEVNHDLDI